MAAAIVTEPASPDAVPAAAPPSDWRSRFARSAMAPARRLPMHGLAVVLLLVACLLLRLWGIKQGLPYSYNSDEATHFVPRAIGFFGHDLNPHYFLNPPGYSYLLYIVFELWFGSVDTVRHLYTTDPTAVFVVARVVAAILGTAGVLLLYLAGRRLFDRQVGLLAAAILAFAFLPVFYSHLALNDVPALAPVALSLYGIAGVLRRGRTRDYALSGLGIGLAAATKYTGGVMLLCLVFAALCDGVEDSLARAARRLAVAAAVGVAAFVLGNPYALLDPPTFFSGVRQQASLSAGPDPVKLGTRAGSGLGYYLWTFTWGLGWGPSLAAVGGGLLLVLRRRIGLVLVTVPALVFFLIYMGGQPRFFGRWLMPIFPLVALLAGYATIELIRWLRRARRFPGLLVAGLATALLLGQSAVADIHVDTVLSRPDTRNLARVWMAAHVPAGSKVVIEPLVPDNWAQDVGRWLDATPTGERWWRWPTWLTTLDQFGHQLPQGQHRFVLVDQYERNLYPALLDRYISDGYCWVMLGSLQAGRAFAQPREVPQAIAYYALLADRARLVYHVSPFARGAHPIPFSFDWSIDYYPRQYRLPGPELSVYHLSGGKCG
ncbi:MAG TPA: glycosyltransferase family 39 protein [Solirubrobacteraceae bacterium]|nr:glycosyltransferase family 39 protein [Solirubrobacteraceae bacterium]